MQSFCIFGKDSPVPNLGKTSADHDLLVAALPFLAYFLALEVSTFVPQLLARVLGLMQWDSHTDQPGMVVPYPDGSDAWKAVVVFIVMAALRVFLAIPAHVVLTRVQASLLPEEDETIVAFDENCRPRTFTAACLPMIGCTAR